MRMNDSWSRRGWSRGVCLVALSLAVGCDGGSSPRDGGRPDAADAATGTGGAAGLIGSGGGGPGSGGATGMGGSAPSCGFVMPNAATAGLPNPASYDTSVAGIVTDKVTGLSWHRLLAGQPAFAGCMLNITGLLYCPLRYAAAYCAASRLGAFSDWRLPTVLELASLVDSTQWYPSIDSTAFPDTPYEHFWSSTRGPGLNRDFAWAVSFANGYNDSAFIDVPQHVRCVRTASQPPPRCARVGERFQVAANLVTDSITGLTWQRGGAPTDITFPAATTYCAGVGTGFRVPSFKEMLTLVEFGGNPLNGSLIDTTVFEMPQSYLWTSTVIVGEYMSVWSFNLRSGGSASPAHGFTLNMNGSVKCVR